MQEVLGRHNEDDAFLAYLATWREILKARVDEATDRIARIRGVRGLILAGSNGLGQPWPLSDIDLIPIYADEYAGTAIRSVESLREAILDEWSTQGWRTGLDIGRLHFRAGELEAAFRKGNPEPVLLLADDRWYHAIDKAYGGRAVLDRDGQATHLAAWFSANRFQPDVVEFRMGRSAAHARTHAEAVRGHLDDDDLVTAWMTFTRSVQWQQISLMERWNERDNSLGRFGTRFGRQAEARGFSGIARAFDTLLDLDERSVAMRQAAAPAWVHERNDRSWRARQAVREPVTQVENDRDVLRVCTIYELRAAPRPPHPAWLGIPHRDELTARLLRLRDMLDSLFPQDALTHEAPARPAPA